MTSYPHLDAHMELTEACRSQYFLTTRQQRLSIVTRSAALNLPVGAPEEMQMESVPAAEPIPRV
jgi:hypothetical protein